MAFVLDSLREAVAIHGEWVAARWAIVEMARSVVEMLAGEVAHETLFDALLTGIVSVIGWDNNGLIARQGQVSVLMALRGVNEASLVASERREFSASFGHLGESCGFIQM